MQRVNGHRFYDLAVKVHPLTAIGNADEIKVVFWKLWEGRESLIQMFTDIPLRVCFSPADRLVRGIDAVLPRDISEAIKLFSDEARTVGYVANTISEAAKEFETVLSAEAQNLDTYLVSQKGTYSTPDLIERAEFMFSEAIRGKLPEQAKVDVRLAGRCLALDNPTTSAFHILRAVEAVMAVYFELVTGRDMPTRMRNWSIYLKAIRNHPDHSERVVTLLDHIRDSYRNPILHPEVVVTEDEAESLLGTAASAIRLLVIEMNALEGKTKSLPLDLQDPQAPVAR